MSNPFGFLEGYEKERDFWAKLKGIGVQPETRYIAERYDGPPRDLSHQLVHKTGVFSNQILAVSDNKKHLEDIKDFINNFPPCSNWKLSVVVEDSKITPGNYSLKVLHRCTGTEGTKEQIKEIVKEFGGPKDAYNFILSTEAGGILGFFPITDEREAQGYADLIDKGANSPAPIERANAVADALIEWSKQRSQKP